MVIRDGSRFLCKRGPGEPRVQVLCKERGEGGPKAKVMGSSLKKEAWGTSTPSGTTTDHLLHGLTF